MIEVALPKSQKLRVAFVHPDLGIGGAERLIVDAAKLLQDKGHLVTIYTSHHSPKHCFEETKNEISVKVYGDFLPNSLLGMFHIVFAAIRSIYLAIYIYFFVATQFDIMIVDQISYSIPILKHCTAKILFYCHFPDKLLAPKTLNPVRSGYRILFDKWEEITTLMADRIVVNSNFTANIFMKAFPSARITPSVLYPGVRLPKALNGTVVDHMAIVKNGNTDEYIFLVSLNRFEEKKNIDLAISAFKYVQVKSKNSKLRLIVAGGYDEKVAENKRVLNKLRKLCDKIKLTSQVLLPFTSKNSHDFASNGDWSPLVTFMPSISDSTRTMLFNTATAIIYTPSNEHFGIVPVEAMSFGVPVIAINSGGPKETIVDGETGYLVEAKAEAIGSKIITLIDDGNEEMVKNLSVSARKHAMDNFSLERFGEHLERLLFDLL